MYSRTIYQNYCTDFVRTITLNCDFEISTYRPDKLFSMATLPSLDCVLSEQNDIMHVVLYVPHDVYCAMVALL